MYGDQSILCKFLCSAVSVLSQHIFTVCLHCSISQVQWVELIWVFSTCDKISGQNRHFEVSNSAQCRFNICHIKNCTMSNIALHVLCTVTLKYDNPEPLRPSASAQAYWTDLKLRLYRLQGSVQEWWVTFMMSDTHPAVGLSHSTVCVHYAACPNHLREPTLSIHLLCLTTHR